MSKELWNTRYTNQEYIYGTEPNEYLKKFLGTAVPGRILFPAEGEGRNAVYAATQGWMVDAFDMSEAGREKALRLAVDKKVKINYAISSLEDWNPSDFSYDCIALIFVHLPPAVRKAAHKKMIEALKPGGIILIEAFTKDQLSRTSGGPKDPELLFDAETLKADFDEMEIIELSETQVLLNEGPLHQGQAHVVRLLASKPG